MKKVLLVILSLVAERSFSATTYNFSYEANGYNWICAKRGGDIWLSTPWSYSGMRTITVPQYVYGLDSNNKNIIRYTIEIIGEGAFEDCKALVGVNLPSSIRCISTHAFKNCTSLGSISLPASTYYIATNAFEGCTKLMSVKIGADVLNYTKIGAFAKSGIWYAASDGVFSVDGHVFGIKGACPEDVVIPFGSRAIISEAFSGCSGLRSVTIPSSVKSIGSGAFRNCTNLERAEIATGASGYEIFAGCLALRSVSLPANMDSVPSGMFAGCQSLKSIEIPETVKSIGGSAFSGCSSLKSINIPKSAGSIGASAFGGCSSLSEITVDPENVCFKVVDGCLFNVEETILYRVSTLCESVSLPSSVVEICAGAFSGCRALKSVSIPKSVQVIQSSTFEGCASLESVTLPEGIGKINARAFLGCSSLKSIALPSTLTEIQEDAFGGCESLEAIRLPDGVTYVMARAFKGCSSLRSAMLSNGMTVIYGETFSGCVLLESVTWSEKLNLIQDRAFEGCASLKTVSLPQSIDSIEYRAFADCVSLCDVYLGGVRSISNRAFANCPLLKKIRVWGYNSYYKVIDGFLTTVNEATLVLAPALENAVIPEGVKSIGSYAFADMKSLKTVSFPAGLTSIQSGSFCGCSSLTEIYLPDGFSSINADAFAECTALVSVDLPESAAWIGERAFKGCRALTAMSLPSGLEIVSSGTFEGCASLKRVSISPNITMVKGNAFGGCAAIESVVMPGGIGRVSEIFPDSYETILDIEISKGTTELPANLFAGCVGAISIALPDGLKSIGGWAFSGCESLSSLVIPDSVESIGEYAFSRCRSLRSVSLPSGLTKISGWTFSECVSLCEIVIPQGVETIEGAAFSGCSGLRGVDMPAVKTIGDGAFQNCSALETAVLPSGASSIGKLAFAHCHSLKTVGIPSSVREIGIYAFYNCESFETVLTDFGDTARLRNLVADSYIDVCGLDFVEPPAVIATFDLCGHGSRTGGGDLVQRIEQGKSAVSPTVCAASGWRFVGWGEDFSSVAEDRTIHAQYEVISYVILYSDVKELDNPNPTSYTVQDEIEFAPLQDKNNARFVGWTPERILIGTVGDVAVSAKWETKMAEDLLEGLLLVEMACDEPWAPEWTGSEWILRSGTIGNSQTSGLSAVVRGKGTLSFKWKVNSETGLERGQVIPYDKAVFTTGDVTKELYGDSDWASVSIELGDGEHLLSWKFIKNNMDENWVGQDCVWLDQVTWTPFGPSLVGDPNAVLTGDAESGYTITPSAGKTDVEVTIPSGVEPGKVTVVLGTDVTTVKPKGANVKIVKGENDITGYLNIPTADASGTVDLTQAAVQEKIVKETLDPDNGAKIVLSAGSTSLTTSETKPGLTYTLHEGATLQGMNPGDSKVGDGKPWTPEITVSGGTSGFYSIGVTK